jgi:hypothetical protein
MPQCVCCQLPHLWRINRILCLQQRMVKNLRAPRTIVAVKASYPPEGVWRFRDASDLLRHCFRPAGNRAFAGRTGRPRPAGSRYLQLQRRASGWRCACGDGVHRDRSLIRQSGPKFRSLFRRLVGTKQFPGATKPFSRFGADVRKRRTVIKVTTQRRPAAVDRLETVRCAPSASLSLSVLS